MEIYMNKKLIAIAIAAAVSAPAMAATSNVEVYGLMSVGVDSVSNGAGNTGKNNTNTTNVGRVSDYASRIGFKGNEDLGNGLKAIWQIEQAVSVDGGNSTTAASGGLSGATTAFGGSTLRNTFVGLSSKDMGTVMLGKIDTPYKTSTGRFDLFADTLGDYNGLVGAANYQGTGSLTEAGNYFDVRPSNVAAYATPNFSGFSAVAAYVFGAEAATSGTSNKGNAYSLAAMYDAGPLYLTAAYEKHNIGDPNTGSVALTKAERKAWKLGAAYSIMDFTLSALYEKTTDDLGATQGFAAGSDLWGHSTWFLSGKYQMGAVALKAQYAKAGDMACSGCNDTGAKQYTLGADYAFSKRTTVYALYTKISNDNNAEYNFALNPAANLGGVANNTAWTNTGVGISGVSLGVKHSF
jgi:predicted porin